MKVSDQAVMFGNRLYKKFRHLKKWAKRTGTQAFRLYDRDIPEIPLVIDFYGNCSLLNEAAIAGALYKRPYEKDEAEEEKWLSVMKESVAQVLGINIKRIFIKQRQRQRGASQYEKLNSFGFEKIINEGGFSCTKSTSGKYDALSFKVNLSDYLDTGLFIDRRLLRSHIREQAYGKRVLNLFSYTGSFSVYAAAGGAVSTVSVDLSNTYLDWARDNFSLNAFSSMFSMIPVNNKNILIMADAVQFLKKAITEKYKWDIIILDPPVFSNSKKMKGNFDLKRDINTIINYCIFVLAKKGKLYLSINSGCSFDREYALDMSLSSELSQLRVTDLTVQMTDEDFKGQKVPKTLLFEI